LQGLVLFASMRTCAVIMVGKLLHNYWLICGLIILVGYFWAGRKLYKGTDARMTETLIYVAVLVVGVICLFVGLARLDNP
jgi:hypothetical protein